MNFIATGTLLAYLVWNANHMYAGRNDVYRSGKLSNSKLLNLTADLNEENWLTFFEIKVRP